MQENTKIYNTTRECLSDLGKDEVIDFFGFIDYPPIFEVKVGDLLKCFMEQIKEDLEEPCELRPAHGNTRKQVVVVFFRDVTYREDI